MKVYKGIGASAKIAAAPIVFYKKETNAKNNMDFSGAVRECIKESEHLYKKTLGEIGEEQAKIFLAYKMLFEDEMFISPMKKRIDLNENAKDVIMQESEKMASVLLKKKSEYLKQRADDIKYAANMIISKMEGISASYKLPEGDKKFILASKELTPADTMHFNPNRLAGLAVCYGGAASHTVILAKSLGIAAVVGIEDLEPVECDDAIIDGYSGKLILNPDSETKKIYETKQNEQEEIDAKIQSLKTSETQSKDKKRIHLLVNIGKPEDLNDFDNMQTDGVGLFRSEFLYTGERCEPSIEKQIKEYEKAIDKTAGKIFTIRTLDVGGDKKIDYLYSIKEENPFLGNRGIRLCFSNPNIFSNQLEAITAAAKKRKIKIMFPMITSADEIKKAKVALEKACEKNGANIENFQTGIMIETPASVIMADRFADYCDFFSIGTNDLVQYIMCADRTNFAVAKNYNPFNMAVIRAIYHVIKTADKYKKDVSICGDLAADTRFTKLFMGMGLKAFSVPRPLAGEIKYKISTIDSNDAQEFLKQVLELEDENEIQKILEKER